VIFPQITTFYHFFFEFYSISTSINEKNSPIATHFVCKCKHFFVLIQKSFNSNGGMVVVEWWNGGMVEWWNGGMVEWECGMDPQSPTLSCA
jgi:hypothetical protein